MIWNESGKMVKSLTRMIYKNNLETKPKQKMLCDIWKKFKVKKTLSA